MENCHTSIEQAKFELMEQLYRASGRDRKGHPDHGLYTGLYQEWTEIKAKSAALNEEPAA
jgi:hypothetical protein